MGNLNSTKYNNTCPFGYDKTTPDSNINDSHQSDADKIGKTRTRLLKPLPRPPEIPIFGHLHMLRHYPDNPWDGFDAIRREYGECVGLKMGVHQMALVSSSEAIHEIVTGQYFSNRPNFARYNIIFGGDKENSLALCSWSAVHKQRRSFCRRGVMPPNRSTRSDWLATNIDQSVERLVNQFIINKAESTATSRDSLHELLPDSDCDSDNYNDSSTSNNNNNNDINCDKTDFDDSDQQTLRLTKSDILYMTSDLFMQFLCGETYDHDDADYHRFVHGCDFIFWDINHCYLIDFFPILTSFGVCYWYLRHLKYITDFCRDFIDDRIFNPRYAKHLEDMGIPISTIDDLNNHDLRPHHLHFDNEELADSKFNSTSGHNDDDGYVEDADEDYLDSIIKMYINKETSMSLADYKVGFADLLAGHAAVANIALRLLGHLALDQHLQDLIYEETCKALNDRPNVDGSDFVRYAHLCQLPITEASLLEALRLASSPIVPHVAEKDTSVGEFFVPSGTIVLFNNYHLNMSDTLWERPKDFDPFRFIKRTPTPSKSPQPSLDQSNSLSDDSIMMLDAALSDDVSHCNSDNNSGKEHQQQQFELKVTRPKHYKPFSEGKRSCLGRMMVEKIAIVMAANMCRKFRFTSSNVQLTEQLLTPVGKVALNPDAECFDLLLEPRSNTSHESSTYCN